MIPTIQTSSKPLQFVLINKVHVLPYENLPSQLNEELLISFDLILVYHLVYSELDGGFYL